MSLDQSLILSYAGTFEACLNASQGAMHTGYSPKRSDVTVSRLLADVKVQAEVPDRR